MASLARDALSGHSEYGALREYHEDQGRPRFVEQNARGPGEDQVGSRYGNSFIFIRPFLRKKFQFYFTNFKIRKQRKDKILRLGSKLFIF